MALIWDDSLKVGNEVMDNDHRELFSLLADFETAEDAGYAALFSALVHHLSEHFERENKLMHQHGFFATHCHEGEHEAVLNEVRAIEQAAQAGDLAQARAYIATAIGPWFLNHRNTMDWVTAQFLQGQSGCGCHMM